ncbi:hypothetical protein M0802_010081 [Mischocyttarus mexicanus]|nr:hypothetical protein M0802_010081 [Mischocyttarus mexicanus]
MSDKEGDNRLDRKYTKGKSLNGSERYSLQFLDKGKIVRNLFLFKLNETNIPIKLTIIHCKIEEASLLKKNSQLEKKESDGKKIFSKRLDKYQNDSNLFSNSIDDYISNTKIDLKNDLYRFSGIQFAKMNDTSVFLFSAGKKVTNDNLFCVEILNTGGYFQLGKWVMPPSIDIEDDILSEYPLDKQKNFKSFLKCCKQHVNCYSYRQEQYNDLKNVISNITNCSLDANLGFTQIHLRMSGIELIDQGEIYNIILFMVYKSNEALPYLINIETPDSTLSPEMCKIFQKYFKPFKMINLITAFEQIISNNCHFIWKKVYKVLYNIDNDLKQLEIENEDEYSSNSMENESRSESDDSRNKSKLEESVDAIVKTKKLNKQRKNLNNNSTSTIITSKKLQENISVNENKVQTTLNDILNKNNQEEKLIENEESCENKSKKSPLMVKDSVKNLRNRTIQTYVAISNKSKTDIKKMFNKTSVDVSIKNEDNNEKNDKEFSSKTMDSMKNLRRKRIKENNGNMRKSINVLNKLSDETTNVVNVLIKDKKNQMTELKKSSKKISKTNLVKDKTVPSDNELNNIDKKINVSKETNILKNDEVSSNSTKTSLKGNHYKYFSSTPKLDQRKSKLDDMRLPEISAIVSSPRNMKSKKNLTSILNENDNNSLSVIDQDCENEQFNEIEITGKTIKKKDTKINNTIRKTNKPKKLNK